MGSSGLSKPTRNSNTVTTPSDLKIIWVLPFLYAPTLSNFKVCSTLLPSSSSPLRSSKYVSLLKLRLGDVLASYLNKELVIIIPSESNFKSFQINPSVYLRKLDIPATFVWINLKFIFLSLNLSGSLFKNLINYETLMFL